MENLVKFVGTNIRELRKIKKLTQEELAEKSGLQTSFLAGVERGERNITLETLEKIIVGLEEDAKTVFSFDSLLIDEHFTKNDIINLIVNLLADRNLKETKLIYKISKEILGTYNEVKE